MLRTKQEHFLMVANHPTSGIFECVRVSPSAKSRLIGLPRQSGTFWRFRRPVQREIGNALGLAQFGGKHPNAKPWKGEDPGVFEVVDDFDGDTYRAVYTVRFRQIVYVLHAFQKKSPRGKRTARTDIELIVQRLRMARQDYEVRYGKSER
jgi:phage-related protein